MTQSPPRQLNRILEQIEALNPQQKQQVLDFSEFLHYQVQKAEAQTQETPSQSAYKASQKYAGCVESGIGDLSSNKTYLKPSLSR